MDDTFILHCGHCGRPVRDCPGCDEGQAIMRAVCDALAMANTPVPVVAPALPPRFVKKGFWMCCTSCGLESHYCTCAFRAPTAQEAKDGAESDLSKRIKDCQAR
jgi:hypothetical protein